MNKTISIVITTFNRTDWTMRSFEKVYSDERVSDIVIVDDHSDYNCYNYLENSVSGMKKVRLYRNQENHGCYFNKKRAISLSYNPFCICLDSDNEIDTDYIDRIYEHEWDNKTILAPDYGKVHLNYKIFSGTLITKENVASMVDMGNFQMLLNTFNLFLNRDQYLKIFDDSVEPVTSDSIYISYLWLKDGGTIKVVPGLEYTHAVHPQSHYQQNCHHNPGFYQDVLQKLRSLK